MKERKVIADNAAGTDSSFVGCLHEKGIWDTQAFWNFYDAMNTLSAKIGSAQSIERELATQISKISSYILNSVIHHLDHDDSFKIQNFDQNSIRDYLERLNLAVAGFFEGKPPREEIFDDNLRKTGD